MISDDLRHVESTTWEEVFRHWHEQEGLRKEWQEVARQKGWDSWHAWRGSWAEKIGAGERVWERYVVQDPLKTMPHFLVGPLPTWQNLFSEHEQLDVSFGLLAKRKLFKDNKKVQAIMTDFPQPTELIGLYTPDTRRIMLIEGHHRAAAIAYLSKSRKHIAFKYLPTIALTRINQEDQELLTKMLQEGTSRKIA